jgi:Cu2+-containing amine oxidase
VLRTIPTVGNYDYLFDYTFQLDGTMEIRVSASGYEGEHDYGARIRSTYSKLFVRCMSDIPLKGDASGFFA